MKGKFLKNICIGVLIFCMAISLGACGKQENTNNANDTTKVAKTTLEKKKILEELISSTDSEMDRLLSIEDLNRYNLVGYISGDKELYAFNDLSYTDLIRRMDSRMEVSVLNQEMYLRGFYVSANNICFSTDSDFIKKQKLYISDFSYFSELSEEDVFMAVPPLEERVDKLKKMGNEEITYYKVLLTSDESVVNKSEDHSYEVIYVLGKSESGWRILDAVFFVNNNTEYKQYTPHLAVDMIDGFTPNTFANRGIRKEETNVVEENDENNEETVLEENTEVNNIE